MCVCVGVCIPEPPGFLENYLKTTAFGNIDNLVTQVSRVQHLKSALRMLAKRRHGRQPCLSFISVLPKVVI